MNDDLQFDKSHEVVFEDEKTLEAGIVYGDPVDTIFMRFGFPEPEKSLTVIMTETEALAVIHMLSGVLLTAIAEQVDEDGDFWPSGNGNDPQEPGSASSKKFIHTDD